MTMASDTDAPTADEQPRSLSVWILQTGEPVPSDSGNPRPMRAMNLSNALVAAGHRVVLWSASFNHVEKSHRVPMAQRIVMSQALEVRLIASPGYRRNIGLGRLWDHAILARNLARALRDEVRGPDVAFVGFPPIETAAVMVRWLGSRSIPCMVDVKDQWPVIFVNALPRRLHRLARWALAPYFFYARRAMREATALSAMAQGFLDWARDFSARPASKLDRVVPLTMQTGQISALELEQAGLWWDKHGVREDGTPRVLFVGSHSTAFDMGPVQQAARALVRAGTACQFVVCGSGPALADWQAGFVGLGNVVFPGWVDRAKIEVLARRSFAALAPYRNSPDFMMSIPNKVIDALALGLPILSPLRGEVEQLIATYRVGMVYGTSPANSLHDCVVQLMKAPELQAEMSENARRLHGQKFSFETVYGGLVGALEQLAVTGRRT